MSGSVLLIVLCGAFLHASWNAIVKGSGDKFFAAASVTGAAGLVAVFFLLFLPLPHPSSWIFIGLSTITQVFYMSLVAAAYKSGDMSEAYPIMRGTPPLLVALVSAPLIGEVMGWRSWVGVMLICSGVLAMALEARRRNGGTSSKTALLALANAGFIAAYTIIDGVGVRASGHTLSYTLWLFLINAFPLAGWALYREPDRFLNYVRNHWRPSLVGGLGTLGSYGLALWAMTMAPIAVVAALRETAILFGVLISVFILKEKVGLPRFLAAGLIVLGAITLRLA
ncbi:EamA family transporter [Ochrobactrum sp. MYb15]|uniref:DMT family transporter n=1 Tax=Brucella TaxID=234 RepID=UPI0001C87B9D|nr:DMT family transporter [Brucella rhizosphaerae]PQZ46959.1 EamA family transporter [Ochrobactrum sp. MYb19]PRA54013.1 EamA family transporter [Ochrobactrum sp. MYb68]PRA61335.1 EamA family transporter [Ochrobactrum sp. MYb18]PRA76436.1 EamA family transporter [Brucella thiophenivorans]PRA91544.1 EamA family transporter [Ochrobactrum sp. MYb14]PRA98443.1 EamA family transporter [Ochrobactrum sp. MYb15]